MSDIDVRRINLNLLPALEALVLEGSVTDAARRMNVSQSAMSHSLARLRETLDDPILAPAGRGLALTPLARRILTRLPTALNGLAAAVEAEARFDPATSSRTFRIATFDYFELATFPELLAYLREHAPGIRLELERYTADHLPQLALGTLDLVVAGAGLDLPGGVSSAPLFDDPFAVIARADHPAIGRRLTLRRYLELGHVLVSVAGRREGVVDRVLRERGLERDVVVRVPHFGAAPWAVLHSDLICTVASTIASRARAFGPIRVMRPPLALPAAPVAIYWPVAHEADPASRWLRGLFTEGLVPSALATS